MDTYTWIQSFTILDSPKQQHINTAVMRTEVRIMKEGKMLYDWITMNYHYD